MKQARRPSDTSPPLELCGDNAAMIAWTCFQHYKKNMKPDLEFKADPRLNIREKN